MLSEIQGNEFYQSLGKLFYAIAMADKVVRPKEVEQLHHAVRQHWLKVDEDEDAFGTDAAYQISIVFDWLQEEAQGDTSYFDEFVDYFKAHPAKFSSKIKTMIYDTADTIASSFAGKNKSELVLLAKLKLILS
jgi:hypothetical protein